jgi:UDP-N-acetylmuramoyl-L-alanyl-D-glutamate--2,6-diaminopimelate ligase
MPSLLLHTLISELLPDFDLRQVSNRQITGICDDSRLVKPGDLFIARPGHKTDGSKFIQQAVSRGAAAVVSSAATGDCPVPQIILPDPAAAASPLAHIFHRHPDRQVRTLGVTGTNGKTTTAYLIRHILNKMNQRCGMIGTVETDDGKFSREAEMTTPGAIQVAELLATMRNNGCRACAMETSSHALDQGRVSGLNFAGGAFTNLTRDHLDYHQDMDRYAAAKARLFQSLDERAVAVVNDDDTWSERMVENCRARQVRFGFGPRAHYRAQDVALTSQGSKFILSTPDGSTEVRMGLIGRHNVANALTAAALVGEVFALNVHQIAACLADAAGAPGRLQPVRCGQPFSVMVDYAHTDDALEQVLKALRPLTSGKLRVLFGCGGDRDRTKRPLMAAATERRADCIYVTSDNPRTEDPGEIIRQIVAGFANPTGKPIFVEPDRRAAIGKILFDSRPGDVVLIAGKGHENYQIIGQTKHHFDDVEEVRLALGAAAVQS